MVRKQGEIEITWPHVNKCWQARQYFSVYQVVFLKCTSASGIEKGIFWLVANSRVPAARRVFFRPGRGYSHLIFFRIFLLYNKLKEDLDSRLALQQAAIFAVVLTL